MGDILKGEKCDKRIKIKLSTVRYVRCLGEGAFAQVHLVIDKVGRSVALKTVRKELRSDPTIVRNMVAEQRIMEATGEGSPFVVRHLGSLGWLSLALEPCLGGDLWGAIQAAGGRLGDEAALFYTACVMEGLQFLESRNILYRDLKPENLLLDGETGYLKIADLGFARLLGKNERADSLVGTAEYLAPEVINGEEYGYRTTLWCLGCLVHEMLSGQPPFIADDQPTLFLLIGRGLGKVELPESIGSFPTEVIRMLCRLSPQQRPSLEMIKKFGWFTGFDWEELRSGELQAPPTPQSAGLDDSDLSDPLHSNSAFAGF